MNLKRPANLRRTLRWLTILTLLTWATQTLIAQWGYGAELEYTPDGQSRFIAPDSPRMVVLELKEEAAVNAPTARLKHVVRCSQADARALDQSLDVPVLKIEKPYGSATLALADIKRELEQHGVNLLTIQFCGSTACRVTRVDDPMEAQLKEQASEQLKQLMATTRPAVPGAGQPSSSIAPLDPKVPAAAGPSLTLRELLLKEVAERFNLDPQSVQAQFRLADEKLLTLSEATHRFEIVPRRQTDLGDIIWDVTASGPGGEKKASVTAKVKAWVNQLVTARALAYKQVIGEDDVKEMRILVDRLPDSLALTREQVIGAEVAQPLGPGIVLKGRMVQASQLVRTGQLIAVNVERRGITMKWVAEARESGVYGQIIRVRRPGLREEFQVRVTGEERGTLVGDGEEPAVAGR